MKKVISTFLALIFMLTCAPVICLADESAELTNIAPNGLAYCSTMKNSNWTPPNSINDGLPNDWHGWEPKYPTIEPGQNTSLGFSGEYCGIKFLNNEYYEIYEINMHIGLHALYRQNATYKIEALVEGVWTEIVTLKDEQFKPNEYASYEDAMENDKNNYHIRADYSYKLTTPITTNNIRISVSDFGKNYPGGDVLIFPYIYEVELIGKRGITPDISLPEGAYFHQNAAYNSISSATSSTRLFYPFRAIDNDPTTGWRPSSLEAGQGITLTLEKEYSIDKFVLNFSNVVGAPLDYKLKIEALVNGTWQKLFDGSTYNETDATYITEYKLAEAVKTGAVRMIFEEALARPVTLCEFEAHIAAGDRSYFNPSRFTDHQKFSSAKGNLAIMGTAYASANLAPYSELSFINDGMSFATSKVWFGGTLEIPVSCGVKLDNTYTVNKVVVYCDEPNLIGDDVTSFNIIAKVDGQDKIIASGKSYDPTKKVEGSHTRYTTVYDFPEGVVTDDVRLEFTRGNLTIPNVLELEIYSDGVKSPLFDGYPLSDGDVPPVYTDVKLDDPTTTPDPDPNPNDNKGDDEDNNTVAIVIGVSLCFVAAAIAIATPLIITIKKGKTNKETDNSTDSEE